jgi:hypothetical protein
LKDVIQIKTDINDGPYVATAFAVSPVQIFPRLSVPDYLMKLEVGAIVLRLVDLKLSIDRGSTVTEYSKIFVNAV